MQSIEAATGDAATGIVQAVLVSKVDVALRVSEKLSVMAPHRVFRFVPEKVTVYIFGK
jgi:hypothetical protein